MARTTTITVYQAGFRAGVVLERVRSEHARQLSVTSFSVQSIGDVAVADSNPWPSLMGRYRDDPTWDGFEDFLREYRQGMDRVFRESEAQ